MIFIENYNDLYNKALNEFRKGEKELEKKEKEQKEKLASYRKKQSLELKRLKDKQAYLALQIQLYRDKIKENKTS